MNDERAVNAAGKPGGRVPGREPEHAQWRIVIFCVV